MTILTDQEIIRLCSDSEKPMIEPFHSQSVSKILGIKVPSFGLSSMGYDISLDKGEDLRIFTNVHGAVVDPLNMDVEKTTTTPDIHICERTDLPYVILPPNSYLLGASVEKFNIPRDVLGICLGKSTLARTGLAVNITPLEPGWSGTLVVECASQISLPMRVYLNVGIAQLVFLRADKDCEVGYDTRDGKYQNQSGLTHAKV